MPEMSAGDDLILKNRLSRLRLEELVQGISDSELNLLVFPGWSVAVVLGHLAVWDFRALELLRRWKVEGVSASPVDMENFNLSLLPVLQALPARSAAELALEAAQAVNHELESASTELISSLRELESKFRLDRSLHRDQHIRQIEAALGRQACPGEKN